MTKVEEVKFHNRNMTQETEFQVPWEGRYKFKYATLNEEGEVVAITGWGGPNGHGSWRTFAPEKIGKVKQVSGTVR